MPSSAHFISVGLEKPVGLAGLLPGDSPLAHQKPNQGIPGWLSSLAPAFDPGRNQVLHLAPGMEPEVFKRKKSQSRDLRLGWGEV